jgi:hypothetical protein
VSVKHVNQEVKASHWAADSRYLVVELQALKQLARVLGLERIKLSAVVDRRVRLPTEEEAREALAKLPDSLAFVT